MSHQTAGVDTSIVLENDDRIRVDEKVRYKNEITGKTYNDIALEYTSNKAYNTLGWVNKPMKADYIFYVIKPLKICYVLPVIELQQAWKNNERKWKKEYPKISAKNRTHDGKTWETLSCCVPPEILFNAMNNITPKCKCEKINFEITLKKQNTSQIDFGF
jgi:hypothetical protein